MKRRFTRGLLAFLIVVTAFGSVLEFARWLGWIGPPRVVTAYLLVDRSMSPDLVDRDGRLQAPYDPEEFQTFKKTVAERARNSFVIVQALKQPGMMELNVVRSDPDPVEKVRERLRCVPGDSEVLELTLDTTGWRSAESAEILNGIARALVEDIRERQRLTQTDGIKRLEVAKTRLEAALSKAETRLIGLEKELSGDLVAGSTAASLQIERCKREVTNRLDALDQLESQLWDARCKVDAPARVNVLELARATHDPRLQQSVREALAKWSH